MGDFPHYFSGSRKSCHKAHYPIVQVGPFSLSRYSFLQPWPTERQVVAIVHENRGSGAKWGVPGPKTYKFILPGDPQNRQVVWHVVSKFLPGNGSGGGRKNPRSGYGTGKNPNKAPIAH